MKNLEKLFCARIFLPLLLAEQRPRSGATWSEGGSMTPFAGFLICIALAVHVLVMGNVSRKTSSRWWPWYCVVAVFCVGAAITCLSIGVRKHPIDYRDAWGEMASRDAAAPYPILRPLYVICIGLGDDDLIADAIALAAEIPEAAVRFTAGTCVIDRTIEIGGPIYLDAATIDGRNLGDAPAIRVHKSADQTPAGGAA